MEMETTLNNEDEEEILIANKRKRDDDETPPTNDSNSRRQLNLDLGLHPVWKTSLCAHYRSPKGVCKQGGSCRYAHGEEELRPRPDNTWDPTSFRANKLRKTTNGEGTEEEEDEEGVDLMTRGSGGGLVKCLIGLPFNWGSDNLKKFLNDMGILYKYAQKKRKMAVGFVAFENVDQVKNASEVLNEKSVGRKKIKVADATCRSHENVCSSGTTGNYPDDEDHNNVTIDNEASITEGGK